MMKLTDTHTSHVHKEALGDHQRGSYQIWTEHIRGFSKEVLLDWVKPSLVVVTLLWLEKHRPTDDTFDLEMLV